MDYAETRELIRLHYELRRLLIERSDESRAAARAVLARIEELVASDAEEAATVGSEIARWQVSLSLSI